MLKAAQETLPRIGIATVYRTLKLLVSEGWLTPVELPGEATRYEIRGPGHHRYFRCRECARIYPIDGIDWNVKQIAPDGFRVEDHKLFLYGVCRGCGPTANG